MLSAADLERLVPMRDAVEAMRRGFEELADDRVLQPPRTVLATGSGTTLVMPCAIGDRALGAKLVSLVPRNRERGRPTLQGLVVLLDPETGGASGLLDGPALTALRTGAVSGLATDLLARRDARVAAVIGSGPQARTQALAIDGVRPLEVLRFAARDRDKLERFVSVLGPDLRARAEVSASPEEAVRGADVVCTATPARSPLFPSSALAAGVHVNAVGSFTPQMRELDEDTVAHARVFVDLRAAALEEAGELIAACRAGRSRPEAWTELGELVRGRAMGRRDGRERTLFKSVGLALQDLEAGALALERARERGVGRELEL